MIDADTARFLGGGCALIVGVLTPEGEPFASRGWSLHVVRPGEPGYLAPETPDDGAQALEPGREEPARPAPQRVRLLLDAADLPVLSDALSDAPIAITAADVPTLYSLQLKGRSLGLVPLCDADDDRFETYCTQFFSAVADTEGTAFGLIERIRPADIAAVLVDVDELFNQTPGPTAGAPFRTAAP